MYMYTHMDSYVHCSIIHSGWDMETTWASFRRWMDKEDVVHIYNKILLSHKKRWNNAIYDNIDGSWEYHARQNMSGVKSQEPCDFTHMWNIKQKAIKKTNKKTHIHREQYGGYQKEK